MIKHNFEDIAVNKDLHLEEFLANMPIAHADIGDAYDKDFYVDAYITNQEVENEIFERAYGHMESDEIESLRSCRKEFQINLSEPGSDLELVGINCFVYAEEGRYCAAANLSDDEKRTLLNHIVEEIPASRQHVDYELSYINARSAERENSSPKKSQWSYEY